MSVVRTTCNRDCPDACAMLVHVEDGRAVRLQGDPQHPVTRGFLCYRTDQFLARQYASERLRSPLVRRGDRLLTASWDAALDRCAETLERVRRESGGASVFHYRSGGSLGVLKGVVDRFFAHFGPVTVKRGDICSGGGDAAQLADFGDSDSNDLHDLLSARAIVLWGKNPHVSGPHLLPVLAEARRRGARVALVDPVRHRGASLADLVVQPRPGGDFALAMGVSRLLRERGLWRADLGSYCDDVEAHAALVGSRGVDDWAREAGVARADVEALATLYAEAPAAILVGWGMQRRSNGAAIVRALDALGLVTGNVGVAGGGVSFYFKRRGAFDASVFAGPPAPRTIREPMFGQEVLAAREPPIRALWITAGNPVVMLPDSARVAEAIRTRELSVVVDAFLTGTAREATVVLPVTTMLEDDDLVGAYGHHYLGEVSPAVEAPVGVRTDLAIVQGLAERLGLGDVVAGDARSWKERALPSVPLARFGEGAVRSPASPRVAFEGRRFPTATGRARLVAVAPPEAPSPTPSFPLFLQALSHPRSQCSQWSPAEPDGPLVAAVHPASAAGVADGARARLTSALGSLEVVVRHDPSVHREVVVVPKGGSFARGRSANALTAARLTDDGEGAALYEEPVRLDPVVD